MNHLEFILWMCLFPLTMSICTYIDQKEHSTRKEGDDTSSIFLFLMWIVIGCLLW